MKAGATLRARVRRMGYEAEGVLSYELAAEDGGELPAFTAGAHVDLHLAPGLVRSYSLCNAPQERARYLIAVRREPGGRGGSEFLHSRVRPGDILELSPPCNLFPLVEGAARHVLIAGGIGITPCLAMIGRLSSLGADFALHYCGRTLAGLPFRETLAPFVESGRARIYIDGGDPDAGLDVAALLRRPEPGTHIYCCGPASLLDAVRRASAHWPPGSVHFESFGPAGPAPAEAAGRALAAPSATPHSAACAGADAQGGFEVEIASTGQVLPVPADATVLQALRRHGIEVESACEAGTCGACIVPYLAGEPDHQDYVLDEAQQRTHFAPCVSRARSARLVLDL